MDLNNVDQLLTQLINQAREVQDILRSVKDGGIHGEAFTATYIATLRKRGLALVKDIKATLAAIEGEVNA